jgi:hypothetical protein
MCSLRTGLSPSTRGAKFGCCAHPVNPSAKLSRKIAAGSWFGARSLCATAQSLAAIAQAVTVAESPLCSLPRLPVQFPTLRNHSFQFFGAWVPSLEIRPPPEREAKTARVNKSPAFFFFLPSTGRIPLSPIRAAWSEKNKNEERRKKHSRTPLPTCSRLTATSFRMGMSGSAHCQWAKKSH